MHDIHTMWLCTTRLCSERLLNNTALGVMLITLNNRRDLRIGRPQLLQGWPSQYVRNSTLGDDQWPVPGFVGIVQELEQQLRTIAI